MPCDRTFTREHMYNPRRLSLRGDGNGPYAIEYRCICGARAYSNDVVKAQLRETRDEQHRQKEESKRLTGAKRMVDLGSPPLPGFEEYV